MKKEEFISELQLKAKSINLELSDKKAELLYEYKNLVIEWNKNINLTAITEDEEVIIYSEWQDGRIKNGLTVMVKMPSEY